ncbi:uncharacterized protein LOC110824374 isoform X2 [Carica papaya]|uniref:uncharacterized protein LOC110824374 isoform X2 n=1 Tax=Carica papaya TaxID=3649 RepID=UPI000B8CA5E2|nr:uncharacterized protein LOC110824374 isoform X2 [Carica papaya]
MDSFYNKKNPEIPKQTNLNANVLPLMIPRARFHHPQSISSINSYSPDNLTKADSSILKYFRSNSPAAASPVPVKFQFSGGPSGRRSSLSPLSAVENLEAVDGILVASVASGRRVSRSGADSGFCGPESPLSSMPSSSTNSVLYKVEICRAWEDLGHCRFGSKCQAHLYKSFPGSGPYTYSTKSSFPQQAVAEVAVSLNELTSHLKPEPSSKSRATSIKFDHTGKSSISISEFKDIRKMLSSTLSSPLNCPLGSKNTNITVRYWSPQDDDIEVTLPDHAENSQSKEYIDAHIHNVLYGPSKRRLPVFIEICPE